MITPYVLFTDTYPVNNDPKPRQKNNQSLEKDFLGFHVSGTATQHVGSVIGAITAITITFIKRNSCSLTHFWVENTRKRIVATMF